MWCWILHQRWMRYKSIENTNVVRVINFQYIIISPLCLFAVVVFCFLCHLMFMAYVNMEYTNIRMRKEIWRERKKEHTPVHSKWQWIKHVLNTGKYNSSKQNRQRLMSWTQNELNFVEESTTTWRQSHSSTLIFHSLHAYINAFWNFSLLLLLSFFLFFWSNGNVKFLGLIDCEYFSSICTQYYVCVAYL